MITAAKYDNLSMDSKTSLGLCIDPIDPICSSSCSTTMPICRSARLEGMIGLILMCLNVSSLSLGWFRVSLNHSETE
jgi:hypothetical protein